MAILAARVGRDHMALLGGFYFRVEGVPDRQSCSFQPPTAPGRVAHADDLLPESDTPPAPLTPALRPDPRLSNRTKEDRPQADRWTATHRSFAHFPSPALMRDGVRRLAAGAELPSDDMEGPHGRRRSGEGPRCKSQITELYEEYVVRARSWRGRRRGGPRAVWRLASGC